MDNQTDTCTVITLHGSLGGVGRTVIAVNLAAALAQLGHKVALVDLDIRFGDVAVLLDIPVYRSIADLPVGDGKLTADELDRCLHTHDIGVTVLPAPVRPTEWLSVRSAHVEQAVALLAQTHEFVILDSPKNYKILSAALEPADCLILVTTLHESSVEVTRQDLRMLSWLYFPRDRMRLVVNATNERTDVKPRDVERLLEREVFWTVPYDRNISTATQLGTPLVLSHPNSEAAQAIRRLAEALITPRAAQASEAPATSTSQTKGTTRSDQSRKVEKITLHSAAGYAQSRRAGIGVADDNCVWIRFIDYPPEENRKCSLCGRGIGFGWRDLRNVHFICEDHIEFSDKTVYSDEVERIRQSQAALASLAPQAAAESYPVAESTVTASDDLQINDSVDDREAEEGGVLGYLEALEWTPEKGDRAVRWELAKYPELTGMRKVVITLCLTRTDPAAGIEGVAISNDPTTVFTEIAKFALMFALVAGCRMAHSGFPEPMTPAKQNQLVSLEMEDDPEAIATIAELYRSGLEREQQDGGFTALQLLEFEFERDQRSELYLAAWASRADQVTRDIDARSVIEAKQAGRDLNELWFEIFSVGIFVGMGLYGKVRR